MKYADITFEQAKKLLDGGGILIDTREETEFVQEHADGAQLLPVDEIDESCAEAIIPDKNTPVILYCRTGTRARLGAERLAALGYSRVYNLGSMVGWPYGLVHGW